MTDVTPAGAQTAGDPAVSETGSPDFAGRLLAEHDFSAWLPDWLQPYWNFLAEFPVVMLPLLIFVAYGTGKGFQAFQSKFVKRLTSRTSNQLDDHLIEVLNRPILPTMIILAMLIGITSINLPELIHNLTVRVLYMILLVMWTGAAMKTAHTILEILSSNRHRFTIIQERTLPAFDMTMKIVVFGASAYMFMLIWGINPTAWLASAGVIGIAVGFAARDTLANFFSGIFIIADSPYKIGDYIILDSGERGIVKQVGMRSTRLLTRDDIEITIPNAVMGNAKIINESGGPWEKERIRVPIGVAYGSDVDEVETLLAKIALDHPEIVRNPAPRVRFRAFGPSSLDFELLAWIDHPELRGRIVHELNKAIYKGLGQADIQIPFPQSDVHIRSMPGKGDD